MKKRYSTLSIRIDTMVHNAPRRLAPRRLAARVAEATDDQDGVATNSNADLSNGGVND